MGNLAGLEIDEYEALEIEIVEYEVNVVVFFLSVYVLLPCYEGEAIILSEN